MSIDQSERLEIARKLAAFQESVALAIIVIATQPGQIVTFSNLQKLRAELQAIFDFAVEQAGD